MEKLDKPCKRDGKMITHRVVCGKVRKMKGGRDLRIEDFEKRESDGDFRIEGYGMFDIPYIYFGESLNHRYYKYAIYNTEHFGNEVRISRINIDNYNVEPVNIDIYQNNSKYLKDKLHKLYNELRKNPKDYKRIQKFIKEKINRRIKESEELIIRQQKENENERRRQRNEKENENKGNENKRNEKRKNAIKKLRKYYKHIHLNNTKRITDNLVRSLRNEGVDLSRNILIKLINQEQEFIQTQIQKSINKHMQSNSINISNVYNNIPENEETYYERFFQEGKRRANLLKTEEQKRNQRNNN
jgi:hypothetical protein